MADEVSGWRAWSSSWKCTTGPSPANAPFDVRGQPGHDAGSIVVEFSAPAGSPPHTPFTVSASPYAHVTTTTTRAHLTGIPPNTAVDVVVTGPSGKASDPVSLTSKGTSRYVTMYRISELQSTDDQEVDFLSNHNSGDAASDCAFVTATGTSFVKDFNGSVITQYCVEMEAAPYSDYVSCNSPNHGFGTEPNMTYKCTCDNWIDRIIAHQDATPACGSVHKGERHMPTCNCTKESLDRSAKYVGSLPILLPWICGRSHGGLRSNGTCDVNIPFGEWYSTPVESQCKEGKTLGTPSIGSSFPCTWRRLPNARFLRGHELLSAGWNVTHPSGMETKQFYHNLEVWKKAFSTITTRPCGA